MKDLETKNLKVRKFKIEDAEDIYKNLATERKLEKCLGYNLHESVEQTKKMISSYICEYEANELIWAIEEKQSNSAIGFINALEVSNLNKYCNIKFGIGLKYVEKHYMEEALICVLEYIFNEKNLNMVVSKFCDGNKEITKYKTAILERIGMKKEAVLRNRRINEKTGMMENQAIYSITKDEFFEFNKKTKILVEVGSTCTKIDKFDGKKIEKLEGKTIQFKKHYNEDKKLRESDIKELIKGINDLKSISKDIYVCGTSIFRTLNDAERKEFLNRFKNETGYEFNIISQEKENELTVFGTTRFVKDKVCTFIGGGGSTEIAIYDKEIKESINTKIGVIDVMQKFPDLADNFATTSLETVKAFIKERLNLPKEKADILILAGGGHEKFARYSGIKYEENTLYKDSASPIMMNIETRKSETERYYKAISLDEIRSRVNDPDWWYATRAMAAFVLVVAEAIGAKYIIPTDIAMIYGLLNDKI